MTKDRIYFSKKRFIFPKESEKETCNAIIEYLERKGKQVQMGKIGDELIKIGINKERTRKAIWMLNGTSNPRILKVWQWNAVRWVKLIK